MVNLINIYFPTARQQSYSPMVDGIYGHIFLEDLRANPSHLTETEHPLDDFIDRWIQSVDPTPDATRRWIQCAEDVDVFVDFRPLATSAGLGTPSLLGLVIHPEYGLWVSIRAVLLSTEVFEPTTKNRMQSPCEGCVEKPCISACPAGAVTPFWLVCTTVCYISRRQ